MTRCTLHVSVRRVLTAYYYYYCVLVELLPKSARSLGLPVTDSKVCGLRVLLDNARLYIFLRLIPPRIVPTREVPETEQKNVVQIRGISISKAYGSFNFAQLTKSASLCIHRMARTTPSLVRIGLATTLKTTTTAGCTSTLTTSTPSPT